MMYISSGRPKPGISGGCCFLWGNGVVSDGHQLMAKAASLNPFQDKDDLAEYISL